MKKYFNKILLVVVLGIWGGVIYKYFYNSTPNYVPNYNTLGAVSIKKWQKNDFKISIPKRDPFLGNLTINTQINNAENEKKKENLTLKNEKVKEEFKWPNMRYFGFVKNKQNENGAAALIKMNQRLHRVKEKDFLSDTYKISKIYRDSVVITFKNKSKTLKKL
ncbi:hypothetical protein [Aureivirga marina]|uniref:hypothetical protein n=1 Tax=Aureivirga marina TaxID=1182451 RepID=UPI0018C9EE66|nr:hypothetical protein [Aureivirga marina]